MRDGERRNKKADRMDIKGKRMTHIYIFVATFLNCSFGSLDARNGYPVTSLVGNKQP